MDANDRMDDGLDINDNDGQGQVARDEEQLHVAARERKISNIVMNARTFRKSETERCVDQRSRKVKNT